MLRRVACCALFVGSCLLIEVRSMLFAGWCLLLVVCCLSFVVLLFGGDCMLFGLCCLSCVVACCLKSAFRLTIAVCCSMFDCRLLLFVVRCLSRVVCCLLVVVLDCLLPNVVFVGFAGACCLFICCCLFLAVCVRGVCWGLLFGVYSLWFAGCCILNVSRCCCSTVRSSLYFV